MKMEYEIVTLEEKIAVGIAARTNNASPDMGAVIGGLWNRFYNEGIYAAIPDKKNAKALGIYTDYEGNEKSDYTVIVACEAQSVPQTGAYTVCKIPRRKICKVCCPRGYGAGSRGGLAGNMEAGFAKNLSV